MLKKTLLHAGESHSSSHGAQIEPMEEEHRQGAL